MRWNTGNLPQHVADKGWNDIQLGGFLAAANIEYFNSGDEDKSIEFAISRIEEMNNAKQMPKKFYARHMEGGTCRYQNETVYVDTDTIKSMLPTFIGKPIYVGHQKVELDKLKETAHGYVTNSFYNELDGWAWIEGLAIDDVAHEAIRKGWSVSNAYQPTRMGDSGEWHNCKYDRSVDAAEFTHLAIVPNPRYENARIYTPDQFKQYQSAQRAKLNEMHNSKSDPKEGKTMFKMFRNTREEVQASDAIDGSTMIELENGKTTTLEEMINAVTAAEKDKADADAKAKAEKEKTNNLEMVLDVGAEKMTLGALIAKYLDTVNHQPNVVRNSKDEEDAAAAAKAAEDAKALQLENEKKEQEEGKKAFEELQNAGSKFAPEQIIIDTPQTQLARGRDLY